MRVTSKGQVTIPQAIHRRLGIKPHVNVEFLEDKGRFYLARAGEGKPPASFHALRGTATVRLTTDEIMRLTRGDD